MHKPFVSVIIVSYNTRDLTLTCLKHVFATTGFKSEELEVIVVDNHSSDGTVAAIKSKYPQVKIVASRANLGFGAGNNLGAKQAQGEYLLLLNTDAYLSATTLSSLVKTIQSNDQISAVGPGFHYEDGSFQQSAGYFPTPWAVVGWMWGFDKLPLIKYLFASPYHLYDARWYTHSRPVDWLMGACVLLKRADFLRVGGFDESIFMYAEEIELFQRLAETTGRSAYFVSASSIVHLGSASTKKSSATRLLNELKGIEYIYRKHSPALLWIIRIIIYTGVTMRIAIFSLIPSRRQAVLEYKKYFIARS